MYSVRMCYHVIRQQSSRLANWYHIQNLHVAAYTLVVVRSEPNAIDELVLKILSDAAILGLQFHILDTMKSQTISVNTNLNNFLA